MAFRKVCETVSKRSSGSRSGSHSPSATPYSLSAAVPATAKSFGVVMHPILICQLEILVSASRSQAHVSIVEMKGLG